MTFRSSKLTEIEAREAVAALNAGNEIHVRYEALLHGRDRIICRACTQCPYVSYLVPMEEVP